MLLFIQLSVACAFPAQTASHKWLTFGYDSLTSRSFPTELQPRQLVFSMHLCQLFLPGSRIPHLSFLNCILLIWTISPAYPDQHWHPRQCGCSSSQLCIVWKFYKPLSLPRSLMKTWVIPDPALILICACDGRIPPCDPGFALEMSCHLLLYLSLATNQRVPLFHKHKHMMSKYCTIYCTVAVFEVFSNACCQLGLYSGLLLPAALLWSLPLSLMPCDVHQELCTCLLAAPISLLLLGLLHWDAAFRSQKSCLCMWNCWHPRTLHMGTNP